MYTVYKQEQNLEVCYNKHEMLLLFIQLHHSYSTKIYKMWFFLLH